MEPRRGIRVFRVGCGVLALVCAGHGAAAAGYRMPITFGGYSNRTETLTNFPALVVFSNTATAGGFRFTDHPFLSFKGFDLRFKTNLNDSGAATLAYEIESWSIAGPCHVWVRVPRLAPDGATAIWATWGDASDSNQLACTTNGAVWDSGFRGVWHMKDGAMTHIVDSSPGRNLARKKDIAEPGRAPGAAGYGQRFDGINDYVSALNPAECLTHFTVSFAAMRLDDNGRALWGGYNAAAVNQRFYMRVENTDELRVGIGNGSIATTSSPFRKAVVQHLAATWDGATARIVVDGAVVAAGSTNLSSDYFGWAMPFGCMLVASNGAPDGGMNAPFLGMQDEWRISSVARSTDWLWAESRALLSNGMFASYGPVTGPDTPMVETIAGATGVTARAAWLTGRLVSTGASETVWGFVWGTNNPGQTLDGWLGGGLTNLGIVSAATISTSVWVSGLAGEQPNHYACWAGNSAGIHVGNPSPIHPTSLRVAVEIEENVYSNRYGNNGSTPMWCFNNTCVARLGTEVFCSSYEPVSGISLPNNDRWGLYRRGADGWQREQGDPTYHTREPTPILCYPPGQAGGATGRLFLSANPDMVSSAQPQLLEFDPAAPTNVPTVRLPDWSGSPAFTTSSYRSTAADPEAGELILFQNSGLDFTAWALFQSNGAWRSGSLYWPAYAPTDLAPYGATRARVNYPAVILRDRAVHFCGVAAYDNWDRVRTLEDLGVGEDAGGMAGRQRGNRMRRLLYNWTESVGDVPFHGWTEVDNTFNDGGWLFANDMHVDATGVVHLIWTRAPMLPSLRDELYPDIPLAYSIEYATLRDGIVLSRKTLVRGGEGADAAIPIDLDQTERPYVMYSGERILGDAIPTARFHVMPDGRLLVIYYVTGTRADGVDISENRMLEIRAGGSVSGPVRVPLAHPLVQFFTATPRSGFSPSATCDLLGPRRGGWIPVAGTDYAQWDGSMNYARVRVTTLAVTASGAPSSGPAPLPVEFTATGDDSEARPLSYYWSFGDGTAAPSPSSGTVSHVYATSGVFHAMVTVSNDNGDSVSAPVIITVTDVAPRKMRITFSGYDDAATLTNFPVLVVFSNNVGGSGFSYSQAASPQGWDLRFRSDDESQELNHEIEQWTPGATSYVWVQVPELTNHASVWAYWGDTNLAAAPAVFSTNGATWDSGRFKAVYHCAQADARDSSMYGQHGAAMNGLAVTSSAPVGQGLSFDGTAAYLRTGFNPRTRLGTNGWAVSLWVNARTLGTTNADARVVFGGYDAATFSKRWYARSEGGRIRIASGAGSAVTAEPVLAAQAWTHLVMGYDGAQVWLYVNGVNHAMSPAGLTLDPFNFTAAVGNLATDAAGVQGAGYYFDGLQDEFRFFSGVPSAAWVRAEYANVASNGMSRAYGQAQRVGGIDGYGIPDAWKIQFFGSTNAADSGAVEDWDRDGLNNYGEWRAGTNPTNGESCLVVSGFGGQGPAGAETNWILRWPSVAGRVYAIDGSTNLEEGFMITVGSNIAATPEVNTATLQVERVERQFYRVRLE